jgi:hypothetical protein
MASQKKKQKKKSKAPAKTRKAAPAGRAKVKVKAALQAKTKKAGSPLEQRLARIEKLLSHLLEQGPLSPRKPAAAALPSKKGGIAGFLSHIPLFSALTGDECRIVTVHAEEVKLGAGQTLFVEGDTGDSLFVVIEGSLEIYKEDVLGDRLIAVIPPGGLVGEMALIEGKPRSANVRAQQASRLMAVSKASFEGMKRDNPQIVAKLQAELLQLISGRLRSTTEKLLIAESARDQARGSGL